MSFKTVRNIGLLAMTAIIMIMGFISFIATTRVVDGLSGILQKERHKLELTECIRKCFLDAKEIFYAYMRLKEKDISPAVMLMNNAIKKSEELKKLIPEEEVAKFITAARRFRLAIVTYAEEAQIDITGSRAIEMEKIALTTANETEAASTKLIADTMAKIRATDEIMFDIVKNNQKTALTGMLIGIIAGLLVAFFMGRGLSKPIRLLVDGTQRLAKGDLTYRVKMKSRDEIGQLSNAFNKMAEDLSASMQRERKLAAVAVAAAETEKKRAAELAKEISERKQAEETLKASENKYRTLVENLPQRIFIKDKNSTYVSCNENYAQDLKIKPNDIAGKTDYDFFPKELAEKYRADDKRIMDAGNTEDIEEKYIQDVREVIVHTVKTPFKDENGNTVGILGIFWDITERKKAEEEREALIKGLQEREEVLNRQKQEMEDSRRAIKNVAEDLGRAKESLEAQKGFLEDINKELDDFTYIVSHDLKEPLRSIDAFSKFVLDDYRDKLGQEGLNYLERVRINAGRMQSLIEDLLEISRIERKKNPFEEVKTQDIINEVNLRLEYAIKQKNAQLVVADNLPAIFCDRIRLTEVFINLVSNAVKFADKPAPVIEIGCRDKNPFYEFYVKDNGPGIEERYFNKVFEIFQRLGKREDHEGTGAGLTIVKKILEMHKGRIWLESKVGEGTTFYFTIPKKKEFIMGRKKLGEILVEKKLVTEEEVNQALGEQNKMI